MCVIIRATIKEGPNSYALYFALYVKFKSKCKQLIKNHIRTIDKACLLFALCLFKPKRGYNCENI